MATTDLHMQILPWDYFRNCPAPDRGLSRIAAMVARHRASHPNTLLLDNGDFLHGNPLGDFIAAAARCDHKVHPAIAAMNALGYDAATLGNHDFNHGVGFLLRALAGAHHPFTLANLHVSDNRGLIAPHLLLDRDMTDEVGRRQRLRIGVVGFLSPHTVKWNVALKPRLRGGDMLDAAARVVPALRAAGADLVIALAHSGIGDTTAGRSSENAATALARIDGIDAVIAGHTHLVFPDPAMAGAADVDPVRGTLAGKPAVMAGFWGSHLGVIDLALRRREVGWSITDFSSRAEPVGADDPALPGNPGRVAAAAVAAQVTTVHRDTLRQQKRRIGVSGQPLHSHFALIGVAPGLRLVAAAQRWHVRRALGKHAGNLPILSAVAPFRAGGRAGPQYFTDVPAGSLNLRSLADLYPYPNRIRAVTITGAQLAEWLERAAAIFRQIAPGRQDQPLLDPDFPAYNFDVIDGLSWQIDLTRPALFSPSGERLSDGAPRVTELRRHGTPVPGDQRFILATNSYRLSSCRVFSALGSRLPVVLQQEALTRDVLRRYVARRRQIDLPAARMWRFADCPGTSVVFDTGAGALRHLQTVSEMGVESAGTSDTGFTRLRLRL